LACQTGYRILNSHCSKRRQFRFYRFARRNSIPKLHPMSRRCDQCGKGPTTGHNVSHSNRRTKRRFLPNLVVKRLYDPIKKAFSKKKICTRCL